MGKGVRGEWVKSRDVMCSGARCAEMIEMIEMIEIARHATRSTLAVPWNGRNSDLLAAANLHDFEREGRECAEGRARHEGAERNGAKGGDHRLALRVQR